MSSDTWAQQNASGSGSGKSPNSKGGAERWFSSGPLVIMTRRGVERRCLVCRVTFILVGAQKQQLLWAEVRSWFGKWWWSAWRAWRGQALWLGVTVPLWGGTVPSLGKPGQTFDGHPCLGLSPWHSLGMAKGFHVDVLWLWGATHQLCCQTSPLAGILFLFKHWYKAQVLWL